MLGFDLLRKAEIAGYVGGEGQHGGDSASGGHDLHGQRKVADFKSTGRPDTACPQQQQGDPLPPEQLSEDQLKEQLPFLGIHGLSGNGPQDEQQEKQSSRHYHGTDVVESLRRGRDDLCGHTRLAEDF
jgi:hypothetical protein